MEAVLLFSDEIVIKPHTSTEARYLDCEVSIREFAEGEPVSLYDLGNGQLLARNLSGKFIEGAEV